MRSPEATCPQNHQFVSCLTTSILSRSDPQRSERCLQSQAEVLSGATAAPGAQCFCGRHAQPALERHFGTSEAVRVVCSLRPSACIAAVIPRSLCMSPCGMVCLFRWTGKRVGRLSDDVAFQPSLLLQELSHLLQKSQREDTREDFDGLIARKYLVQIRRNEMRLYPALLSKSWPWIS